MARKRDVTPFREETIPGPDFAIPDVAELGPAVEAEDPKTEAADAAPPAIAEPAAFPAAEETPPKAISLTIPLGDVPADDYLSKHVELRLTHGQAVGLRRLWRGLQAGAAVLSRGTVIESNADAVRWLLEQLEKTV